MVRTLGRRKFLAESGSAALAPLALKAISESKQAQRESSAASVKGSTPTRRIAVEEHWISPEVSRSYGMTQSSWLSETRSPISPDKLRALTDLGEVRLAEMDAAGIDVQVISAGSIQALPDLSEAVDLSQKLNDRFAAALEKYPNRFAGFAALPLQDPKAAADELERAVRKLGMKGAMISGVPNHEYLDAKKYWVLWERSESLGVPIYIHPADPAPEFLKMWEGQPILLGNTWAWGVETATQALRVIASGVFDSFPKATIILGHLGEALPFLLGRMDEGLSSVSPRYRTLKQALSEYVKENILVTTSGWYQPEALTCVMSALGADRVLFADDYPYVPSKLAVEMFEKTPMSDSDRNKIYNLNAKRWLNL
jgi:2,3-dihydroxybenzoate decarboxylase